MAVTKVGIVYYADDPEKQVFRIVYPQRDDAELDGPPTNHVGDPYLDEKGNPHSWTTLGVDPDRTAVMEKVQIGDPRIYLQGTP